MTLVDRPRWRVPHYPRSVHSAARGAARRYSRWLTQGYPASLWVPRCYRPVVTASGSPRRGFAGINVNPLRLDEFLRLVRQCIADRRPLTVTFLNPDYTRRALRNDALRSDIDAFDLVLVDGNGVRVLTPLFGFTVPERLDTDRVAHKVFELADSTGGRVFLFGCAPGVAERAALQLQLDFPDLQVVGTEHGFHDIQRGHPGRFSDEDSLRIVEHIKTTKADLLLVSLPTPLQQSWVITHGNSLSVPLIMTGGSYLDHLADQSTANSWYPEWVDRLQLNWLYRLVREPRRLWRRYSLELLDYTALVLARRFRP